MNFKSILACAALLIGVGTATAAVQSDVVGYTTIEVTQKYTLLGVSFFDLADSTQDTIPVNDFISGDFADGDQIQVPKNGSTSEYDRAAWNSELGKWCTIRFNKPSTTESSIVLKKGTGVWFVSFQATEQAPVKVTLKGRALLSATAEYDCAQKYSLVSLPIYEAVSVNATSLIWAGLQDGDQIQVPKNGSTTEYDRAAWNSKLGKWCTIRFNKPSTTESPVMFKPYEAAWLVSTGTDASCIYDSTK